MGVLDKYVDGSKREEALDWKEKYEKANRLADDGRIGEAIVLYKQNLDWSLESLGANHNCTVSDQEALAQAFYSVKNFKEAARLDLAALTTRISVEGTGSPSKELIEVQLNLAQDYVGLKRYKDAARIYEKVYNGYSDDNIQALRVAYDLAACWHNMRDYAKSHDLNQRVLEQRIKLGASDRQVAQSREALKQNLKKIENAKKTKEAAKKVASESRKIIDKGSEEEEGADKANERKKAKERTERKRLEDAEARALERERLAKEDRLKERAEKSAAEEKARIEKIEARRAQARKDVANRDFRTTDANIEKTSSPISIPAINVQKPQLRRPEPISRFPTGPSISNNGKTRPRASSQDSRVPAVRNSGSPVTREEEVELTRRHGEDSHRPRASSQNGRDIQSRRVSRSSISPKSASLEGSAIEGGGRSDSLPGSWVSDKEREQRRKSDVGLEKPKKELQEKQKNPSPSLKPEQPYRPPPDLSRSRSLNSKREKEAIPSRARSSSPNPRPKTTKTNRNGRLFDAKGGKNEDDSAYVARCWFDFLETETQRLLRPNRKPQCKRVRIAILDTGIDLYHPDFAEDQALSRMRRRIKVPEDFLDPDGKAHDTCGHGTHCVGVLRKVAPEADIYVARVAQDFDSDLDPETVVRAINRACNSGKDNDGKQNWNVDIITMSFGFSKVSKIVRVAIQQALLKPVLVFAAASNGGLRGDIAFPASMTGVFCINSASGDGVRSRFNPELKPDKTFSIIGEDVISSWTRHQSGDLRRPMSGTSVATPVAAAVAALILEYVLQDDPESFIRDQLDEFREYDGMSRIFSRMSKMTDGYQNIVPWKLLSKKGTKRSITGQIEAEMLDFKCQSKSG